MAEQPIPAKVIKGVGTGAYTEITAIEAPMSAVAGSLVQIKVTIRNKYSSELGIRVYGELEHGWPTISFPTDWANFPAGASYYFSGSFTMPAHDSAIYIYSYYYGYDYLWHFDDERTKSISLSVVEAQFQNLMCSYAKA